MLRQHLNGEEAGALGASPEALVLLSDICCNQIANGIYENDIYICSNGLQPTSDGLQVTTDGLQPSGIDLSGQCFLNL